MSKFDVVYFTPPPALSNQKENFSRTDIDNSANEWLTTTWTSARSLMRDISLQQT